MKKTRAKKNQRRKLTRWQWWLITGAVLALVFIGIPAMLITPGSTKPIRDIADRFQPPSDWALVSERVTPPQIFCIGDNPCPSLHRTWNIPHAISSDELQAVINVSGSTGSVKVEEDECRRNSRHSGSISLCHASGTIDDFKINITQWIYTPDNSYTVTFSIEKE